MRTILLSLSILLFLFLTSCDSNVIYKDHQGVKRLQWKSDETKVFNVPIDDTETSYQLIVAIRHHSNIGFKDLDVNLITELPSGKASQERYTINLLDDNERPLGEIALDITDREQVVVESFKFEEKGNYKFSISHGQEGKTVPGIMEVGLVIRKAK
ncbi:MAG: hypothetical protein JJT94_17140 [Bernardetiaceae bacterium]|nr:hypothetical protein [Bernardetiaceae bacterium]